MSRDSIKKIGFIGRVDSSKTLFDGQTVKTRTMYRLLSELFGQDRICVVDTKNYKRRPFSVTIAAIKCLLSCDDIFVLLSSNGRKYLFPLLAWAARMRGVRIYHNLIGGWLARDIENDASIVDRINQFEVNWVESRQLEEKLRDQGVKNVEYLPNFKYLDCSRGVKKSHVGPNYSFCTFSRVMEKKGIADAVAAVEEISARYRKGTVSLDIYGPIDADYEQEFFTIIDSRPYVNYCGCVDPEDSVRIIEKYDALLFPTKWYLEGIPGTIIDALASGVPIIASHWQYYDEMLEDGKTGFSYEFGRQNELATSILELITLGDGALALREECQERSKCYSPEVVRAVIVSAMGRKCVDHEE